MEKTFVDKLATTATMTGRTTASHRFLRLAQPISAHALPTRPKVLLAGQTYSVPFTFVIPAQLLPRACNHKTANHAVRHAHLQLPPSFGDPDLSGYGGHLLDDLAPEMARVSYFIKARLIKTKELSHDTEEEVTISERVRKIRVKPAYEEAPPLDIEENAPSYTTGRTRIDERAEYNLRAEKVVKKGLFKGKAGRLSAEATQPASIHLPFVEADRRDSIHSPVSTMARVRVRFDPAEDNIQPPRLDTLVSKLKVTTFFASAPRKEFPSRKAAIPDMSQGVICETLPLSSRCVASANWERHDPSESPVANANHAIERRDSAHSGSSNDGPIPAPEGVAKDRVFYTANVLVPITLPLGKHFVPTFHTCLISRVYALSLNLGVHTSSPAPTSLSLRVPVQISSDGGHAWTQQQARRASALSTVEEEMEFLEEAEREVEAVWTPRRLSALPGLDADLEAEPDLPPGYDALGPTGRANMLPVVG
jgi:hypothetical protein